jgi:7-cyano-7-deazaguanine synthase in queuosine biosynthesis
MLRRGTDYSFNDSGFALGLTTTLPARLADLLDLALAAYVADRRVPRPGAAELSAGRTWARQLDVRIGVRDSEFWIDQGGSIAADLLRDLTDDSWTLIFDEFDGAAMFTESIVRLPLSLVDRPDSVALFSGGLDSLAGAVMALEGGRNPLLLSVETNTRMAATQRNLRRLMRSHWPLVGSATASVGLLGGESSEPSQRARGFLFLALAGALAAASDIETVEVYENGIGAIGLPYLPNQEGAHTTKAMHPATLKAMHRLASCAAGKSVKYENPSLWLTKAEMCSRIPDEIQHLVPLSESCDTAFSYRGEEAARCGRCTSCLLRRQALWAAGLEYLDERQKVRIDLVRGDAAEDTSEAIQLLSMLDQAERIDRALRNQDPWTAFVHSFPELLQVAISPADRKACLRLYASYSREWHRFPSLYVDRYFDRPSADADLLVGGHIYV